MCIKGDFQTNAALCKSVRPTYCEEHVLYFETGYVWPAERGLGGP